jgi:hypothetical protein
MQNIIQIATPSFAVGIFFIVAIIEIFLLYLYLHPSHATAKLTTKQRAYKRHKSEANWTHHPMGKAA